MKHAALRDAGPVVLVVSLLVVLVVLDVAAHAVARRRWTGRARDEGKRWP